MGASRVSKWILRAFLPGNHNLLLEFFPLVLLPLHSRYVVNPLVLSWPLQEGVEVDLVLDESIYWLFPPKFILHCFESVFLGSLRLEILLQDLFGQRLKLCLHRFKNTLLYRWQVINLRLGPHWLVPPLARIFLVQFTNPLLRIKKEFALKSFEALILQKLHRSLVLEHWPRPSSEGALHHWLFYLEYAAIVLVERRPTQHWLRSLTNLLDISQNFHNCSVFCVLLV